MDVNAIVANFLSQYRKPFSLQVACELTTVPAKYIRPLLRQKLATGKLKEIEPGIYVIPGQHDVRNSAHVQANGQIWSYSLNVANALLDLMEPEAPASAPQYPSIRSIALAFNRSHQYVYLYLEALASLGCVGINKSGYHVIHRNNLSRLGTNLDKGILSRLRDAAGICATGKGRSRK